MSRLSTSKQLKLKFQILKAFFLTESKVHGFVNGCLLEVRGGALLLDQALLALVVLGQNHSVTLIILTPIVLIKEDLMFNS